MFRKRRLAGLGVGALFLASLVPAPATAVAVAGGDKLYTTDADFDQGTLVDVNHDSPNNNQLQLDQVTTPFPFVNVAASGRGTAVRINVDTGQVVGEYRTAPAGQAANPSRTTVDKLGNVWVTNRDQSSGGKGSVARIGIVQGGTRTLADGTPDPTGQFLSGPFAYNTCLDRDSDGLLRTSLGLANILPWTNAGGVDTNGGVATAQDECIINYTRVTGTNARTVAVDSNNDVWVGGLGNLNHEKLSGATGQPISGTQFNLGCGGYGGFVHPNGTLWSARGGNGLLRYNTGSSSGTCLGFSRGDYGLGLDPNTGEVWHSFLFGNRIAKLDANGNLLGIFAHGNDAAQGVAVDKLGNVWVAHSLFNATTVGHLKTDGTFVGNVVLPGGNGPTGVAVDSNGKVWVTNINSNNVMRIDPNAGPIGGGGFRVGAVDLTVPLGPGASPYNYSDMTGAVLGEITAPSGTWSVVQDSGAAGTPWGKVTWNTEPEGSEPAGTSITFEARASDTEAGLAGQPFTAVSNASLFSLNGRFIEVRATLTPNGAGDSPILSDVRIEVANRPPDCSALTADRTLLWPPNHTFRDVTVTGATDPDAGDSVTHVIDGITQDEPVNGKGDGATSPDGMLSNPLTDTASVRAERSGSGDGRVYRLHVTATDTFGAACSGTVSVGVPRDQRPGGAPVDSAPPGYDSTTP